MHVAMVFGQTVPAQSSLSRLRDKRTHSVSLMKQRPITRLDPKYVGQMVLQTLTVGHMPFLALTRRKPCVEYVFALLGSTKLPVFTIRSLVLTLCTGPFIRTPLEMSSDTENASILRLAESILENTKEITSYLQSSNIALPTFSPSSEELPSTPDFQKLQSSLRTQLEDLQLLVDGPPRFYRHFLMQGYEIAAVQIALDFGFFTLVPGEGSISVEDLAHNAGLDPDRTGRVMRLLITHRFFQESRPGFFSHNSFSIALQGDDEMRSMVHYS